MIPENHNDHPAEPGPGGDDLERLLARHAFRMPPPDWRDAILAQAVSARASVSSSPAPGWFAFLNRLSSGWSPIAAAWLLVLGLNQYSAQPVGPRGMTYPPLSATSLAELRADRAELRELANLTAPAPAPEDRPSPVNRAPAEAPTRPRAQLPAPPQSLACVPHLHPLLV